MIDKPTYDILLLRIIRKIRKSDYSDSGLTDQEMDVDTTLQVRQRGSLTLPAEIRRKYGIKAGDTFRLVDLDGIFLLTPMVPIVPELVREIERARLEAGLDMKDLLTALRELREKTGDTN